MGVLEDLLGTSTRARTTTQTSLPATPKSVEQTREELLARTRGFAAEPFQPYVDAQGNAIPVSRASRPTNSEPSKPHEVLPIKLAP